MAKKEKTKKTSSFGGAFKFSADAKSLEAAVKKATGALLNVAKAPNFFLYGKGKKVFAIVQEQGSFCCIEVENAKAESSGAFGIDSTIFTGAIKNRSILNFEFTGTECLFKQAKGNYNGKLITLPVTDEQADLVTMYLEKDTSGIGMTPEIIKAIKHGLDSTSIVDVFGNDPVITVINLSKKNLLISSRSIQHFATFEMEIKSKVELQAAIPVEYFATIDALAQDNPTNISFTNQELGVTGEGFTLFLPSVQVEDKEFTIVQSFIEGLRKPGYTASLEVNELATIVDNLFSLYKEGSSDFELSSKGDSMKISLSTPSGSAGDKFATKGAKSDVSFSVNPRMLKDLVRLAAPLNKPKLQANDSLVMFKGESKQGGSVMLACAKSQEQKKKKAEK